MPNVQLTVIEYTYSTSQPDATFMFTISKTQEYKSILTTVYTNNPYTQWTDDCRTYKLGSTTYDVRNS